MQLPTIRTWWHQIETPDEWLAVARLASTPILWGLALARKPRAVGAMVLFTASTDVLDGAYAHLAGTRSDFSQQLDTMADMAVIFSAPGLIALLFPDVARQRASHVGLVILVAAPVLLLEWRKFRRLGALHINSARATAFVAHLWVLNLLGRNQDSKLLFRLFLGAAGGAALESLYVIIRQPDLDRLSETPLLDDLCATFGVANPIAALLLSDPTRQTTRK